MRTSARRPRRQLSPLAHRTLPVGPRPITSTPTRLIRIPYLILYSYFLYPHSHPLIHPPTQTNNHDTHDPSHLLNHHQWRQPLPALSTQPTHCTPPASIHTSRLARLRTTRIAHKCLWHTSEQPQPPGTRLKSPCPMNRVRDRWPSRHNSGTRPRLEREELLALLGGFTALVFRWSLAFGTLAFGTLAPIRFACLLAAFLGPGFRALGALGALGSPAPPARRRLLATHRARTAKAWTPRPMSEYLSMRPVPGGRRDHTSQGRRDRLGSGRQGEMRNGRTTGMIW